MASPVSSSSSTAFTTTTQTSLPAKLSNSHCTSTSSLSTATTFSPPTKPTPTSTHLRLSTTCSSSISSLTSCIRRTTSGTHLIHKWRTNVSFFPAFLTNKSKDAKPIKDELLLAIAPLDRGADATPQDQQTVDQIVRKLEAANPTKAPLKSPLLNGKWELLYTTSQSILQRQRPKFLRSRKNYQAINADVLRAQNMESFPFFNQVTADLMPLNPKKVAVKFDYFKIGGLIPVKAPDTAVGSLEITFLDEELRVSRGDKGNLFILKMIDPSYRIPE